MDPFVQTQLQKQELNLKPSRLKLNLMTQGAILPDWRPSSVFDCLVEARDTQLFMMNEFKTRKAKMAAKQALENLNG